nr:hypothetical protein OG999_00785 [Streptomyces sp. NBC_00886]
MGTNVYTLHNWMKADRESGCQDTGAGGALSESEREELARLRAQKTQWDKERAELLMERDVLKRSVVLWVKAPMNR